MAKEYIEREAALTITKMTSGDYMTAFSEIRQLSAADVVEVVRGEWILSESKRYCFCPKCAYDAIPGEMRGWNYCPVCGAILGGDMYYWTYAFQKEEDNG